MTACGFADRFCVSLVCMETREPVIKSTCCHCKRPAGSEHQAVLQHWCSHTHTKNTHDFHLTTSARKVLNGACIRCMCACVQTLHVCLRADAACVLVCIRCMCACVHTLHVCLRADAACVLACRRCMCACVHTLHVCLHADAAFVQH